MTADTFFTEFGNASRLIQHIKGLSADEAASQIYELYKRQAAQMDTVITQGIQAHARELSMGKLPDSCLLILSILDNYKKSLKNDFQLTERQRKDYGKFEYECYDRIHISGKMPMKRSNNIEVNGTTLKVPDSLFTLFLRLVVELKKETGGWVNIASLQLEKIISDDIRYQQYSNLRSVLQGSLLKKDGQEFIQGNGSKEYRISTHPDFVTYDKEKLISHISPDVQRLAAELP